MLGVIQIVLQFKISTLCGYLKSQSLWILYFWDEMNQHHPCTPPQKKSHKKSKTPYLLCLFLSLISSAWRDKQIQSALSSSLGHITETKRSIKIQTMKRYLHPLFRFENNDNILYNGRVLTCIYRVWCTYWQYIYITQCDANFLWVAIISLCHVSAICVE